MAKARVNELAKELDIQSKDLLDFLSEQGIPARTASSTVEDDVVLLVRNKFGKKETPKKKEKPAPESSAKRSPAQDTAKRGTAGETSKPSAEPPAEKARPKKKASISAVYNPQNSKMGDPQGGKGRGQSKVTNERTAEERQQRAGGERPKRPAGERPKRAAGERPARPEGERPKRAPGEGAERPKRAAGERRERPEGERPRRAAGERPARPEGERPRKPGGERPARPAGERRERPEAEAQERRVRPEGEHPAKTGEERPAQTGGERNAAAGTARQAGAEAERRVKPAREHPAEPEKEREAKPAEESRTVPEGERQAKPAGERQAKPEAGRREKPDKEQRQSGDRQKKKQSRQEGERNAAGDKADKNGQKADGRTRGASARDTGDRGGRKDRGDRNQETKGKPDRNAQRRDSGKAPAPDQRGKDSNKGGGSGGKNGGKKKKQDYDKKSKKKENYVNLEKKTGHKKRNAVPQAPGAKKSDEIRNIVLPEYMTVRELADIMKVPASDVVKKLFMQGIMATVNQEIDYEKAEGIALEFNCIAEPEEKVDAIAELLKDDEDDEETLVTRPPVVCVMGHVDHGKTSLLDAIRNTRVTDKEAGGITQAIGASVVTINGQKITFLDTPGHEAFTAMRMRGANSTDIAILVVAADDGIMPQTVEAINHAKAAGVEIIVAINKIDKEGANIERVKQGLTEYDLVPEDWGGSTICVPVSAKTGEGITDLLEMILLSAEVLELTANPKRNARGLVIEAQLDKGRGPVATVLVQKGTLKVGQVMAAGSCYGRVRAMIDDKGNRVKEAGPSTPVEVLGLSNVPNAGEVFVVCDSEKEARDFAETFVAQDRERLLEETRARMSLDDIFSRIQAGNLKELDLIVKADVQGSVEAVKQSLTKLSNDEVVVKVIHGGVGNINESDVSLAAASDAVIIGFNVKPDPIAKSSAEEENVDIRLYNIIYKAIEDVEAAMKGMLDPIYEEQVIGHAEIRQLFKASGVGNIAGSYVTDGVVERGSLIRLSRDGKQIYEGSLASLKRFKDDVKEVKSGYECGLVFDGFNDIAEGDTVEAYKMVEVPRT